MEFTGTVLYVSPIQSGVSKSTNKAWQKLELVVEQVNGGQYPDCCCFTIFGEDKIKNMHLPAVGNLVKVSFDIKCHQTNGRYYNTVNAWRIDPVQQNMLTQPLGQQYAPQPQYAQQPQYQQPFQQPQSGAQPVQQEPSLPF